MSIWVGFFVTDLCMSLISLDYIETQALEHLFTTIGIFFKPYDYVDLWIECTFQIYQFQS